MKNELNKWIKDTEVKVLKIRLHNNVYGTLIAIFRNDTKKICVCEIDNAYTFNEAEINSTDWKLATYIPVEILKNL